LQTYGSNAWRIHNYLLEATAKQTEKALEELKDMTVEVNRQRKNDQVRILKALALYKKRKENFNDNYRIDLESN
jgi:pre-mRNA-splicing factor SPF27